MKKCCPTYLVFDYDELFVLYFFHIGSNPSLKVLKLEDINLSDYHQEILQFLEHSVLEGTTQYCGENRLSVEMNG